MRLEYTEKEERALRITELQRILENELYVDDNDWLACERELEMLEKYRR